MKHWLKTDPEAFAAVAAGNKTCEIRLNDRDFAVHDILCLTETEFTGAQMQAGARCRFTGSTITVQVTHVLKGYGLQEGWVALSFKLQEIMPGTVTDTQLLDWLDKRAETVVESQNYDNPYGEHVSNAWHVEYPATTVRKAILGMMKDKPC